jgi:hypothetical protein
MVFTRRKVKYLKKLFQTTNTKAQQGEKNPALYSTSYFWRCYQRIYYTKIDTGCKEKTGEIEFLLRQKPYHT